MTEDAPLEPVAPEPEPQPEPQADPTQPVPAPTAGQPAWPSPADAPPPKRASTVAVPIWLVLVVGALLFGLIGFGIGWIAAPGDDHSTTIVRPGGFPNAPNGGFRIPGNGSGNGSSGGSGSGSNGDGSSNGNNDEPTIPTPARGAFLGVATEVSTDPAGAKVLRVVDSSPAADAGLKADDVITKVDGDDVANPQQLATAISSHRRGDKVTVTYVRDGKTDTTSVTLVSRSSIIPSTPSTTRPGS